MQGKSILNPHATPYVPRSNISSEICSGRDKALDKILDSSDNCDYTEVSAEYLPDSVSWDDIQSFEKLHVSGESSSKLNQAYDIFQDELTDFSDQNWVDDPSTKLQYLSSIFPNFSVDSLAEMLNVHYGDINVTIDMLQQFEYDGDEFGLPLQTAEASNNFGPKSQKASASKGA